jgi:DNA-directed RNA polymerase specialized sigma24 family protein
MNRMNPELCCLFSFFSENQATNFAIFEEFCLSAQQNSHKLPEDDSARLLLFTAALKLLKKKINRNQYKDCIRKIHETLYDDIQLEPFPESFFAPDELVFKDRLLRFRTEKLNSARRFLFDLIFAYGFTAAEISRLFGLSENMIEPFIFTCFQQLMGKVDTEAENFDGFNIFSRLLYSPDPPSENCGPKERKFHEKCRRLVQFFSQDIRPKFEQSRVLAIYYRLFPDKKTAEATKAAAAIPAEESLIEKIRRKNEAENLQDYAHTAAIDQPFDTIVQSAPKADERAFKILKPAIGILFIFFTVILQKTLSKPADDLSDNAVSSTASASIESLASKETEQFGKSNCEGNEEVFPGSRILSFRENCQINLKNSLEINMQPGGEIRIIEENKLFLQKGSIKLALDWKEKELHISTPDGEIMSKGKSLYLAKNQPEFTTAGVENGSLKAICSKGTRNLKTGQETRLGSHENSAGTITAFNPSSYTYYEKRNFLKTTPGKQTNSSGYNTTISQEEREKILEILPEAKTLLNEPQVSPKSFLHEL